MVARLLQDMRANILTSSLAAFSLTWARLNQHFRNEEVMRLVMVRGRRCFSLSLSSFQICIFL